MRGHQKNFGFTIVELLIVVVVIGILVAIVTIAYSGIQASARDSQRIAKVNSIAKAIELYYVENGRYPPIRDGSGIENSCGSLTENWGQCDRMKMLTDFLDPYIKIDPTSLSNATQGSTYTYYYDSPLSTNYQSYGFMVYLEGNGGQNDGGYYANAYEVGPDPSYCMRTYTGASSVWRWSALDARCVGGN